MHGIDGRRRSIVRDVTPGRRAPMWKRPLRLESIPRFAWPTSGFEMARLRDGVLELSGLGDCCAYVLGTGRRAHHPYRHAFEPRGRDGLRPPDARCRRRFRAGRRHNARRPDHGGNAARPGAAQYARRFGLDARDWCPRRASMSSRCAIAARPGTAILLMSDGFCGLCEAYQLYDEQGLVEAAHANPAWLTCCAGIRHVERVEDPARAAVRALQAVRRRDRDSGEIWSDRLESRAICALCATVSPQYSQPCKNGAASHCYVR